MPSSVISVSLGEHFYAFVRAQVESGRFNNASEVVRSGLRLLEDERAEKAAEIARIRQKIDTARKGPFLAEEGAEAVFDRLEAKYAAMAEEMETVPCA
jgi:antitoxin ParD1/3/4